VSEYAITFADSARKEFKRLREEIVARAMRRIRALATDPRPAGCKKLKGGQSEWCIRVGDYRVVYSIDDENHVVDVSRVRHRSDVYEQ
jgi:mRNA interferase RelE/StbE